MAWTITPKEIKEYDEGVNVTVEITDGVYVENFTRPCFHPKNRAEVLTSMKNMIAEVKARKEAQDNAKAIVIAMASDINKPIPEAVQIEE